MQWNFNSARSKIPLIKDYVIREKINILGLLRFYGFDTNHKGRTDKGGGGGHGPHNR